MSKQTENSFFIVSSMPRLYQPLLFGIASYEALGNRIIERIKAAHAFRRVEQVRELAAIPINIPIREYQLIGQYYLVWCNCRNTQFQLEELERIVEQVQSYKSQALASRAAFEREPKDALYFYTEALKTARSVSDYIAATFGIAAIKGMEGFHQSALKDMERVTQLARRANPIVFFNFYNSYATELGEVGMATEARNISRIVLASPFAADYPEWQETGRSLRAASRSFVTVSEMPESKPVTSALKSKPTKAKAKPADVIAFPQLKEAPPPEKPERVTPQELREMTPDEKRELILAALRSDTIMPANIIG